jgi:hypothetical protein
MYWRSALLTGNPIRQATLVVVMLRKLEEESKLTPEQIKWLPIAEAHIASLRQSRQ